LLKRYLANQLKPEEANLVREWLKNNPDDPLYEELFAEKWVEADDNEGGWNSEASWQSFRTRHNITGTKNPGKQKFIGNRKYWAIAASMVLVLGLGWNFFKLPLIYHAENEKPLEYITKSTEKGQKLTVFLKDGSKVILNAASRITYPEVFSDSNRLVFLEGEGFFEVAENKAKPFLVHIDGVEVKVLGTSFNVLQQKDRVEVSLVSGKVQLDPDLSKEDEPVLLAAGEAAEVITDSRILQKYDFDPVEKTGWKEGNLVFAKVDFDEILKKLELWYGVEFEVENRHNLDENQHYSGQFHNESLQNVLESIGFSKDFDFSIAEDKVIINCKPNL
jgi:ferric-dicitrate binding protein FerR (iron transport regulator)